MYAWDVHYSTTKKECSRITCETFGATVYADDEDEVRAILAEQEPGTVIDKITRGERIEDE